MSLINQIWIPETEIKFIKKISSGAFAKVFQGLYKGKYLPTYSSPRPLLSLHYFLATHLHLLSRPTPQPTTVPLPLFCYFTTH